MLRDCAKSLKRSQSASKHLVLSLKSRRSHREPDPIVPTRLLQMNSPRIRRECMRMIAAAVLLIAIAGAQGCAESNMRSSAASTAASNPPSSEARVIVRFRPGSPDPSDVAFRTRLASRAQVSRVDLLHAMSGDAYVITVTCDATAGSAWPADASSACAAAIKRLGATEWVLSIESDGREKLK